MGDAELVLRIKQGEQGAFEDLVRLHMKEAFAFCFRLTGGRADEAEELSQDGFVAAYRNLAAFRGECAFRSWLFRILINLHRDRLRARSRWDKVLGAFRRDVESRREPVADDGGGALRARELADVVREKVRALPDRQREVLTLHVYQGLSYHDIGLVLSCSYDDVKMNLSLARKRLREALKEYV
ncbi:MAG: sigma-70 family RNA polymerase sigma factor [Planctomycetes bacterium]|nr:sigma-70 family RNA polymerase sigma factor [Planctomycetota bacterium]